MATEILDARGRPRVQTVNKLPSKTVQADAKRADINHIMRKFSKAELLAGLDRADLQFLDVTEFTDLSDALRQAAHAERVFMRLPSKVRELFNHNVAEWLDAAHDPEKRDAVVRAGELLGVVDTSIDPASAIGASSGGTEGASEGGATTPPSTPSE
jgi:hypothetical protein